MHRRAVVRMPVFLGGPPLLGVRAALLGLRAPLFGLRAPLFGVRAPLLGLRAALGLRIPLLVFGIPCQAGSVGRLVGGLLRQVGLLLGPVGGFRGPLGPLPRLLGRLLHPAGPFQRLILLPLAGPLLGQLGGLLSQVGPLLGAVGGLFRLFGQFPGLLGGPLRPVRGFLCPEPGKARVDLRRRNTRRLRLTGVPLFGSDLARVLLRAPVTAGTGRIRPRRGCAWGPTARRATLYGSPVCAMRWRAAVFWALFRVIVISFPGGSARVCPPRAMT